MFKALILLLAVSPFAAIAADCSGGHINGWRKEWLQRHDIIDHVCGLNNAVDWCARQPAGDCRAVLLDLNVELLFHKEWTGAGTPNYQNCEGAAKSILEQCFDTEIAKTGTWTFGDEKYTMKLSHPTLYDPLCDGQPGGIELLSGDGHPFDYNAFVNVANSVINFTPNLPHTTGRRQAGDPNWRVIASRLPAGDATYNNVEQAMAKMILVCFSRGYIGATLTDRDGVYNIAAVFDNEHASFSQWTALGDSYSAGVGAGTVLPGDRQNVCRRYDRSYPSQINGNADLDAQPDHTFHFYSCSGSKAPDVLRRQNGGNEYSQIDKMDQIDTSTITTLSIGGNDVGFFFVLNACVYQFTPFYHQDCDAELRRTQSIIDSPEFHTNLDNIIDGIFAKAPGTTLLMTGYAAFFNPDHPECDNVTFSFWSYRLFKKYLTQDLRNRINALHGRLNAQLGRAIVRANARGAGRANFVDYDSAYGNHRFCEPGIQEPAPANPQVWFYQASGEAGDPPLKEPVWEGVDPKTCQAPAEASGDWGELAACYIAMAQAQDPSLSVDPAFGGGPAGWTPNELVRIFHPKVNGHTGISNAVLGMWDDIKNPPFVPPFVPPTIRENAITSQFAAKSNKTSELNSRAYASVHGSREG